MIDKMLVKKKTDMQFPRREAKPFASFDLDKSEQLPFLCTSFSVDYKYVLRLEVGTEFISNSVEAEHKEKNARMQLRHALYQDVISGLYEIIGASSEPEVQSLAAEMIDQMVGK
jgi:hypothetical protein